MRSFQCRDALRHRGRRVGQGLRGAAERPAPPDLPDDDQRLQIEHEARLTGSTKQSELVLTDGHRQDADAVEHRRD